MTTPGNMYYSVQRTVHTPHQLDRSVNVYHSRNVRGKYTVLFTTRDNAVYEVDYP